MFLTVDVIWIVNILSFFYHFTGYLDRICYYSLCAIFGGGCFHCPDLGLLAVFFFLQLQRLFPKRFDDCTVPSRLGFQRFHAVVVLFKGAFPFSSLLEETVVGCPCIYCTRSPLPKSSHFYPMSFCCVFDTLVESGFSISSINFCL